MDVRTWWDNAREDDQAAVLHRLRLDCALAGVPWEFLPGEIRDILNRRVRIHDEKLADDWRRTREE